MKETFIVRSEWFDAISELGDADQAIIFRNLFNFHNGNENLINLDNLMVKLVWKLIEPNLIRNSEYYDKRRETSSENGKKGGRPKNRQEKPNKPNKPNLEPIKNTEPIESLSDTDIVYDTDPDTEIYKKEFSPLLLEFGNIDAFEAKERYLTRPENIEAMNQLAMVKHTTPEYISKWVDKFTEKLIAQAWRNTMQEWLKHFGNWINLNYKSELEVMQLNSGNSKTIANLTAAEKAIKNIQKKWEQK